jgi:hypothetical protein
MPPSTHLQHRVTSLPNDILDTPAGELSTEDTTEKLWDFAFFPVIRYAVKDVDQHAKPSTTEVITTLYSPTPDDLICPTSSTSPRLHYEAKSWAVFDAFAPQILALAQHVDGGRLGTSLELRINEEGARSIIMKVSWNYLIAKSEVLTCHHYFTTPRLVFP